MKYRVAGSAFDASTLTRASYTSRRRLRSSRNLFALCEIDSAVERKEESGWTASRRWDW